LLFCLCAHGLCGHAARAGILDGDQIGVYGDSLSWQYSLWVPLAGSFGDSINFDGHQVDSVGQLVRRGVHFGPPVDLTGGGNYYNRNDVAFGGNQSSDLPTQVDNLQPYIASNDVKLTVLEIGGNNFTTGVGNEYSVIYTNAASPSYNPLSDPAVQA